MKRKKYLSWIRQQPSNHATNACIINLFAADCLNGVDKKYMEFTVSTGRIKRDIINT